MAEVVIRAATADDAATIVHLIRELATFEDLLEHVRITADDVRRDGFGAHPRFACLLAEAAGNPLGFALYFHTYSTFEGHPGIFLEDLYVAETARGLGIGRKLIARLAAIAIERNCHRLDLCVLHWNPARAFYRRLGFTHINDWHPYRLDGDRLRRLAEEID